MSDHDIIAQALQTGHFHTAETRIVERQGSPSSFWRITLFSDGTSLQGVGETLDEAAADLVHNDEVQHLPSFLNTKLEHALRTHKSSGEEITSLRAILGDIK